MPFGRQEEGINGSQYFFGSMAIYLHDIAVGGPNARTNPVNACFGHLSHIPIPDIRIRQE